MYKDLQIVVAKHPHPWIVLRLRQKKELKMMMMTTVGILRNKFLQYYHFHNWSDKISDGVLEYRISDEVDEDSKKAVF
jgi:hypothetical protein